MTHQPSRRAFIAAASLLPLAPLAAQAASAPPAPASVSPKLQRAMTLCDRLRAAAARFYDEVDEPTRKACRSACDAYPSEPEPPHEEVSTTFLNLDEDVVRLSTANAFLRTSCAKVMHDPTWADMGDEDWRQAHRELHDAYTRRDAVIADQQARKDAYVAEERARFGLNELTARAEALDNRWYALWRSILAMPCASIVDLAAKLAYIEQHEPDPEGVEFRAIAADIRLLAQTMGGRA